MFWWPLVGLGALVAAAVASDDDDSSKNNAKQSKKPSSSSYQREQAVIENFNERLKIFLESSHAIFQIKNDNAYKKIADDVSNGKLTCSTAKQNFEYYKLITPKTPYTSKIMLSTLKYNYLKSPTSKNLILYHQNELQRLFSRLTSTYDVTTLVNTLNELLHCSGKLCVIDDYKTLELNYLENRLEYIHRKMWDHKEPIEEKDYRSFEHYPELVSAFSKYNKAVLALRDNPLPCIAVCGEVKAGKSTLLNMLTEDLSEQRFPADVVPKTTQNDSFTYQGIRWLDTPGISSTKEDDLEANEGVLNADFVLYVHSCEEEINPKELNFLKQIQNRFGSLDNRITVVLTRKSKYRELVEQRKQRVHEVFKTHLNLEHLEVFPVESPAYKKGREQSKEGLLKLSGIDALRDALIERREQLKIHIAGWNMKTIGEQAAEVSRWNAKFRKMMCESERETRDRHIREFQKFQKTVLSPLETDIANFS